MKLPLFSLLSTALVLSVVTATTPLQFCSVSSVTKTNLCFAITSWKNSTTLKNDLSLHISAKFVVDAKGWAGVGIGSQMNNALMFVVYPGGEEGRVTTSIRTTTGHNKPGLAEAAPEVHVTRSWRDDDDVFNSQLICYSCESWNKTGSSLDVMSTAQPWIWATNWKQQTHSDDMRMSLATHNDRGFAEMNMASSFSSSGPVTGLVSSERISQIPTEDAGPAAVELITIASEEKEDAQPKVPEPPHPAQEHHKHGIFGLVSIHGFLLATGFFILSFGILGIRSGLSNAYKVHWVIQTVAGSSIVVGCLMGVYLSYKHGGHFNTIHQWTGLSLLPSVIIQGLLGYMHHINFLKYKQRSAISHWHIWIGRIALLAGNLNVGFGLQLAGANSWKWYGWYASQGIQLSVLIPMWVFWARGKTVLDVVRDKPAVGGGVKYESVEQDAFIVNDELDEFGDERYNDDGKQSSDGWEQKGKEY